MGLGSATRLYAAYLANFFAWLISPDATNHPALFIPGKSPLRIYSAELGIFASVRPNSDDLIVLTTNFEQTTSQWFEVEPGSVVVDVGAYIGRYALVAARKGAKVIAIEPDPANFSLLESNIRLNGLLNVTTLRVAVSNRGGTLPLYVAAGSSRSMSSLETDWTKHTATPDIEVKCETLDRVVESLGLERIDWLKIDVEGHEVPVLEGARRALRKVDHLILEVGDINQERCRTLMREAGLELVSVGERYRHAVNWLLIRKQAIAGVA